MAQALSRRALFEALRLGRAASGPTRQVDQHRHMARFEPSCVERSGVACRRCAEVCSRSAIRFRLLAGGRAAPDLNADLCDGCGECLPTCPVLAITLVPVERAVLFAEVAGMMQARAPGEAT